MEIFLNGKKRVSGSSALSGLLAELKIEKNYSIIEVDGRIIKKDDDYDAVGLSEGSIVEIMRFVGGG